MLQMTIFDVISRAARYDGDTVDSARDNARLDRQMHRVSELMSDGQWRTLEQISEATGDPQTSVSARLRDLRKARWGNHNIERRYVKRGLFEYRMGGRP